MTANPFARAALDQGRAFLSAMQPKKPKPRAASAIRRFYSSRAWRALRLSRAQSERRQMRMLRSVGQGRRCDLRGSHRVRQEKLGSQG